MDDNYDKSPKPPVGFTYEQYLKALAKMPRMSEEKYFKNPQQNAVANPLTSIKTLEQTAIDALANMKNCHQSKK